MGHFIKRLLQGYLAQRILRFVGEKLRKRRRR